MSNSSITGVLKRTGLLADEQIRAVLDAKTDTSIIRRVVEAGMRRRKFAGIGRDFGAVIRTLE